MADDPLAPIQAGDDVRKILSASRQNALADAARIVRGSLPVRWARRKRPPRPAGTPTIAVGGDSSKFSFYDTDSTHHTESAGVVSVDGSLAYMPRFANTPYPGFPSLADHDTFEWVDVDGYDKHSIRVKRAGIYRATLEYFFNVTGPSYALSPQNTGSSSGHTHTYSRAPTALDFVQTGIYLFDVGGQGGGIPAWDRWPVLPDGAWSGRGNAISGCRYLPAGGDVKIRLAAGAEPGDLGMTIKISWFLLTVERVANGSVAT